MIHKIHQFSRQNFTMYATVYNYTHVSTSNSASFCRIVSFSTITSLVSQGPSDRLLSNISACSVQEVNKQLHSVHHIASYADINM